MIALHSIGVGSIVIKTGLSTTASNGIAIIRTPIVRMLTAILTTTEMATAETVTTIRWGIKTCPRMAKA